METPKYLVRLDDASEYMSINKWEAFFSVFDKYEVKPIVAVIPHVEDKMLIADHPRIEDFWERVFEWQTKGYAIALHGYNHVYTTKRSGIIKKNRYSEFAGVSYKKQEKKIAKGLALFKEHGIETKMFVAPAHSFDNNTIKALLNMSNIRIISDGFSHDTFFYKGMYWIPQQLSHPEEKNEGVWTICYHPENAEKWQLDELSEFIKKHKEYFVCPVDVPLNDYFTDEDKMYCRKQQRLFIRKHLYRQIRQIKQWIFSFFERS